MRGMHATKKTSGNRITLPKAVIQYFADADYFDVQESDGKIIFLPVRRVMQARCTSIWMKKEKSV